MNPLAFKIPNPFRSLARAGQPSIAAGTGTGPAGRASLGRGTGSGPAHRASATSGTSAGPAGRASTARGTSADPAGRVRTGTSTGANAGTGGHRTPGTFTGAVLPICGVEVLIVAVHSWVLTDIHEANLYVVAFHERFRRTVVLMAQGPDGTARFYGPTAILRVLQALPCELIPWRRLLFRTAPPPSWQLPVPQPRRGGAGPESFDSAGSESFDSAFTTHDADPDDSAGSASSSSADSADSASSHSADAADAGRTVNGRAGRISPAGRTSPAGRVHTARTTAH